MTTKKKVSEKKVATKMKVVKSTPIEKRVVTQVKLHRLIMNPLIGDVSESRVTATSTNRKALVVWMNSQLSKKKSTFARPGMDVKGNAVITTFIRDFEETSYLNEFKKLSSEDANEFGQGVSFVWVNEDVLESEKTTISIVEIFEGSEILTYPATKK